MYQVVRSALGLWAVTILLVGAVPATGRAQSPEVVEPPAAAVAAEHDDHAKPPHDDHAATDDSHGDHGPKLGSLLPPFAVIPFSILLLCIAVFPLANPHWWEHNSNKGIIAGVLGVPVAAYLASFGGSGIHAMEHAAKEYVSFLLLLGSLFAISGGIYVRGAFRGTPVVNAIFLALGGAIASLIGTTGASMVLIRPLLRANRGRSRVAHVVVFFIFIVSNCGGLLTPLGDPPLFLGFLKGVPFEWTLRLFPQWLLVNGILLGAFFIWDTIASKTDPHPGHGPEAAQITFGLEGFHNFAFLAAIVAIIYCSGQGIGNGGEPWPWGVSEALMALTGAASFLATSGALREKNNFSFGPIIEVAVLFAGIFVTMIPALALLNVHGKELGVTTPMQYFWASGTLSSFLDNAPTYLAFAATACGTAGVPDEGAYMKVYLEQGGASAAAILAAISCGSVFMGANTYIGNGPNFMVKAIAEENNVRMPGFFGYMAYSVGILIPIFIVVTFVFFL